MSGEGFYSPPHHALRGWVGREVKDGKEKRGGENASPKKNERDASFDQNFDVNRSIGPLKDRSMFDDKR